MIPALDLAKHILYNSVQRCSPLRLMFTIYITELCYIRDYSKRLLTESYKTDGHKPLLLSVYEEYRNYGPDNIDRPNADINLGLSHEEMKLIDGAIGELDSFCEYTLVECFNDKTICAYKKAYRDHYPSIHDYHGSRESGLGLVDVPEDYLFMEANLQR